MADEVKGDTGLGLSEFLNTASPAPAETSPETPEVTEATEAITDPNSIVEPEVKTDEAQVTAEPVITEEPKPVDWESEAKRLQKQYQDTRNWATQVQNQNVTLQKMQRDIEIANKKLDGTYDPAVDDAPKIEPQAIAQTAELAGKISSSREAAFQVYGADLVEKMLWAENAPFKEIESNPVVEMRILSSPTPVLEAMKVMEEYAFYKKWGNKPQDIETNIRKAYEKEIEDKVTKKVLGKMKLADGQSKGIGEARSASPGGIAANPGMTPLSEIFHGR
jgi:DNA primase